MGWFEYEKATIKEQTVKNLILNINGNLGYTVMANAFDDRPIDIVYANNVRKDQILKLIIETKVLMPYMFNYDGYWLLPMKWTFRWYDCYFRWMA